MSCCGRAIELAGIPVFPPIPTRNDPLVQEFLANQEQQQQPRPIAIIGGGATGVFAAASLERMGITNYVLLEASDRIGGRLMDTTGLAKSVLDGSSSNNSNNETDSLFLNGDIALDLGAEWIHANNGKKVVRDMLVFTSDDQEHQQQEQAVSAANKTLTSPNKLLEDSNFIAYNPTWYFRQRKVSVMQWFYQETKWNRSTWFQYLNESLVEQSSSTSSPSKSSANVTTSNNNDGGNTLVPMDKIRLNAPVTNIVYNSNSSSNGDGSPTITLDIANGTERIVASKVICTIPLAVLKTKLPTQTPQVSVSSSSSSFFQPPLSKPKAEAIERVRMPGGYRILFEMKTNFYPDVTSYETLWSGLWSGRIGRGEVAIVYDALYGKTQQQNQTQQQKQHNVLAFVAIGPHHAALSTDVDNTTDDDLVRDALQKIDELFDGQGSTNYVSHVIQNWTREPYILGVYSFDDATEQDRAALGESEYDGNLMFAGEHTSTGFVAMVTGAAMEGRRAAVEAVTGERIS